MSEPDSPQPPNAENPGDDEETAWFPENNEEAEPRRTSPLRRVAAAVTVVVFITFLFGGLLRILLGPDLGFIRHSQELSTSPKIREWKKAVVQIVAHPLGPGPTRSGTGFNIEPAGVIVTNRHVVENANELTVTFPERGMVRVNRVLTHPDVDMAVVVLDGSGLPVVPLNDGALPSPGQHVVVIGNPLGFPGIVSEGDIIGTVHYGAPAERLVELSAPIHPGSSGSPVFDNAGNVMAVVFAVIEGDNNSSENTRALAVPILYLQDMLPDAPFKGR